MKRWDPSIGALTDMYAPPAPTPTPTPNPGTGPGTGSGPGSGSSSGFAVGGGGSGPSLDSYGAGRSVASGGGGGAAKVEEDASRPGPETHPPGQSGAGEVQYTTETWEGADCVWVTLPDDSPAGYEGALESLFNGRGLYNHNPV
jgi:hypothetical protein